MSENSIVKGTAARWLFPVVTGKRVDSLIMVMNITNENGIGTSIQAGLSKLAENEIAISQ